MFTPMKRLPWSIPTLPRLLTALPVLAGLCGLGGLSLPAHAQAEVGRTLDRIAQTGTINLGHREASVPFSYYDARRQVVGYSHELMLRVLDSIKAELKLPALTLKLVPVTAQNRIPLLQNGTVDLECGSTTHNLAREREVAFSNSIFVIGTRLMVPRGSAVRDFTDLAGKRVVLTAGTTSERLLRTYAERRGMAITIEATKDHDASFRRLETGEADAYMMDDALLHGVRARALRPDDWEVVGQPMSTEVYACAMRRGDDAFKRVVDTGLARLMQSGEALRIYQRWFQKPIPPRGLNLAWPPSEALLDLYRSPNDRPRD